MKSFESLTKNLDSSINYFSNYVSKNSIYEHDDVKQELLLQMFKAKDKYNSEISCEKTFFVNVLKMHSKRLLRNMYLQKNKMFNNIIYLHSNEKNEDRNCFCLYSIPEYRKAYDFIDKVELNLLLDVIEKELIGNALEIFKLMRYTEYDLGEISYYLKLSKENICNIVRRKIRPIAKKYVNNIV